MKKVHLLIMFFACFCTGIMTGQAQIFTLSSPNPSETNWGGAPIQTWGITSQRIAYLIPSDRLAAGNLPHGVLMSSVAFERGGTNNTSISPGVTTKIYLENKPVNYLNFGSADLDWADIMLTATLLYHGDPANIVGTTPGFKTFPFGTGAGSSASFTYTGGAIAVYIETFLPAVSYTDIISWNLVSDFSDFTVKEGADDYLGVPPSTLSGYTYVRLPHIQFVYTNPPCSSPPVAGTTISSTSGDICKGAPVTISLTGNGYGSGQTYQLQSAAASNGAYTNLGAPLSVPDSTFPADETRWYRYAVTCSGQTSYANPVRVTVPALFPGGTYTIDKSQPTGGANFASFTEAAAAVSCGTTGPVVFNVVPGATRYNEQFELPHINTASAANTITFNGNNDTIAFAGTAAAPHTVSLNGADYIRFNDLHFVGTDADNAMVLHLWNEADNNIFNNCSFTATTTGRGHLAAVAVNCDSIGLTNPPFTTLGSGSNNTFSNCTVTGGYYGILLVGTSQKPAHGNQILNCRINDFYRYGVYLYENEGLHVKGNDIARLTRTDLDNAAPAAAGIYASGGCPHLLIERNKIHDLFAVNPAAMVTSYGIQLTAGGTLGNENQVINNIVYNMESNGNVFGISCLSSDYINIYHNTVCLDYGNAISGSAEGIISSGATGGVNIRNNNVSIVRGGTGTKFCMRFQSTAGRWVSDNNNLYINSPAGNNYIGWCPALGNSLHATLSDWQQATGGLDMNSTAIDPAFANASAGDLRPTSAALDNKGIGVQVITDLLGVPRNLQTPDIGAFEFGTLPCDAVNNLQISGIKYDSATVTWNAVLGANGYEYVVDQTIANPSGATIATTDTSHLITPLLAGTKYYIHIRTNCITGNTSSWVVDSFTTQCLPVDVTVTTDPATEVCEGDTITLSADATVGATYQWYKSGVVLAGATDTVYYAGATGNYELFVTLTPLCQYISNVARVRVHPLPIPVITPDGNTLRTDAYTSYQWNREDQAINGATAQTYTITETGVRYTVSVTDSNGCSGTSEAYTPASGITAAGKSAIRIYPNPAHDMIYIQSPVAVNAVVRSPDGKILFEIDNAAAIDMQSLPAGIYIINILNQEQHLLMTERVIKVQ